MKRLVVYYSYGGHTKMIVDMVTAKKECDVLKIEPMVAYSEDYDYLVNEYQDNAVVRQIKTDKYIQIV